MKSAEHRGRKATQFKNIDLTEVKDQAPKLAESDVQVATPAREKTPYRRLQTQKRSQVLKLKVNSPARTEYGAASEITNTDNVPKTVPSADVFPMSTKSRA